MRGARLFPLVSSFLSSLKLFQAVRVVASVSNDADSVSRYTVAFGCVRRTEAGAIGLISPSRHAFTARAFCGPGTTAIISRLFRIRLTDMEMARVGTSGSDGNQPSFTC